MRMRQYLGIGLLSLAFTCNEFPLDSLEGEPLSCDAGTKLYGAVYVLNGVVRTTEEKEVEFKGKSNNDSLMEVAAAIQSEIDDGDKEYVRLRGFYKENGVFEVSYVEANGLTYEVF